MAGPPAGVSAVNRPASGHPVITQASSSGNTAGCGPADPISETDRCLLRLDPVGHGYNVLALPGLPTRPRGDDVGVQVLVCGPPAIDVPHVLGPGMRWPFAGGPTRWTPPGVGTPETPDDLWSLTVMSGVRSVPAGRIRPSTLPDPRRTRAIPTRTWQRPIMTELRTPSVTPNDMSPQSEMQ